MRSLLVLLLACGSTPPTPKPDPVAVPANDPAPCSAVGANVTKFIDKAMPSDKIGALVNQHCADDKWSVELRKCIVAGQNEKDFDRCEQYFVGTQIADFKRDLDKLDPGMQHGMENAPPPPANGSDVPPAANPMPK